MPKSIKWRLQLWYGLILVAVLAGLGATAYQLERNRIFRRVDDELHRRVDVLVRALHGPPRRQDRGRPDFGQPPPRPFPDDGFPGRFNPGQNFTLPPEAAALFDTNNSSRFFFLVRDRAGAELAREGTVPANVSLMRGTAVDENAPAGPNNLRPPPRMESVDGCRELIQILPSGEFVLVGCSLTSELTELRLATLTLAGVGAAIWLVGLAGGWWFVGRALRPIADIGATAARISAGDLSQRVNIAEAQSELGQLAAVLNSTFARLETAFAQQKQFAADAAHELRTPVAVILTQTQLALGRERDAASYRQTVEACQRAAQRMRRLIEALLELARFDAGQEVLNRQRFDVSRTVSECVDMVQSLADERNVKISAEVKPTEITGDALRLAQVVTNLLTNAVQYNHPNGEVRVTLVERGGLAILQIVDTGKGIAPDTLPRIFERFYRADESRTGGGNAGLGLSICKAVVEAHGGTIEVSSRENAGSTFVVRLPTGH